MGIIFGTAGVPLRVKSRSTLEGIQSVFDMKLGAMEMEFVHGVNMKEAMARDVCKIAGELNISLSIHAPYYINLLSVEKNIRAASRMRIVQSVVIGCIAGVKRIVFHPAYYGKLEKKQAFEEMREQIALILNEMKEKKATKTVLAPEVMGKHSTFGTIDENFSLSAEFGIDKVNPCIDFGHLHARTNGGMKSKQDFLDALNQVEGFGKKYLQTMHMHFEGIAFTEKGEKNHLPISSKSPDFEFLAEALIEKGCSGTIICESPEMENDALELVRIYERHNKGVA